MRERTLVLVKPDGVHRGLCGEVLGRFERKGLKLVAARFLRPSREMVEEHYAVHKGKPFFGELVDFLSSGPVLAMVIEGANAIAVVRGLVGPTDPAKAPPGTIRGDLGLTMSRNVVHASDATATAQVEIALWFPDGPLEDYERTDERWVYAPE